MVHALKLQAVSRCVANLAGPPSELERLFDTTLLHVLMVSQFNADA